jgi:hypothetical protein
VHRKAIPNALQHACPTFDNAMLMAVERMHWL